MKLWSGMLSWDLDKFAEEFNSSIKIDQRLVFDDIKGSIAHVKMLKKTQIIEADQADEIIKGLQIIKQKLLDGKLEIDLSSEDIYQEIDIVKCVNERKSLGGPAKKEVERQIAFVLEKLS